MWDSIQNAKQAQWRMSVSYKRIFMDASTITSKTTSSTTNIIHNNKHHPKQQHNLNTIQHQFDFISFVFFLSYFPSSPSLFSIPPSLLACLLASLLPPFLSSFLPSVHLFICLFLPKQTPSLIQPIHPSHIPPHHPPQPLFISRINLDFHFLFFISFFSFLIFFFSHPLTVDYPHHLFFLFLFLLHILTALAYYLPTSVARTSLSHLPSRSLQSHTTHTYIYYKHDPQNFLHHRDLQIARGARRDLGLNPQGHRLILQLCHAVSVVVMANCLL